MLEVRAGCRPARDTCNNLPPRHYFYETDSGSKLLCPGRNWVTWALLLPALWASAAKCTILVKSYWIRRATGGRPALHHPRLSAAPPRRLTSCAGRTSRRTPPRMIGRTRINCHIPTHAASCYWMNEMSPTSPGPERRRRIAVRRTADLFRLHAQAVFAVCLANTQNYHDAEDVMQAVFLKAIAKTASLREPRGPVPGYCRSRVESASTFTAGGNPWNRCWMNHRLRLPAATPSADDCTRPSKNSLRTTVKQSCSTTWTDATVRASRLPWAQRSRRSGSVWCVPGPCFMIFSRRNDHERCETVQRPV